MGALIFIAQYGQNKELMKKISKENLEKLIPLGQKVCFGDFRSRGNFRFLDKTGKSTKGYNVEIERILWNNSGRGENVIFTRNE